MNKSNIALLTVVAMTAFAANSLLCRMALRGARIDAASFTLIRLTSGALMLWFIVWLRGGTIGQHGSWVSALALFSYRCKRYVCLFYGGTSGGRTHDKRIKSPEY